MTESVLALGRRARQALGGEAIWKVVRPLYWTAMSTLTSRHGVSVAFSDGLHYRITPRFYSWRLERYEPDVVRELTRTLAPDSVVFDVGAHVGIMTLIAARRIDPARGRVFAFEPAPPNFTLLRKHIGINGLSSCVVATRALVADAEQAGIPFVHRPGDFTANSLAYAIDGGVTTMTPVVTIDGLIESGRALAPTHLKIDVEGFEAAVLRGARETLKRYRPLVICAVHPEPLTALGETPEGLVRFMADVGYSAFDMKGDTLTEPAFEEVVFRPAA